MEALAGARFTLRLEEEQPLRVVYQFAAELGERAGIPGCSRVQIWLGHRHGMNLARSDRRSR